MHQEVKHFDRVSNNLKLIKRDLRMRLDGLLSESKSIREKILFQDSYVKGFKDDIFECLQKITDYKKLKKAVIKLHKVYVKADGLGSDKNDGDEIEAFAPMREYLEKNLQHLRQNLTKDKITQKAENARIMKENVSLLQEINNLKKQLHYLFITLRRESTTKKELKRLRENHFSNDTENQHPNQNEPQVTSTELQTMAKDLQNMDSEMEVMRQEEQKWMDHLNKLKYASEIRRQQIEAAALNPPQLEQEQPAEDIGIAEQNEVEITPIATAEIAQEETVLPESTIMSP